MSRLPLLFDRQIEQRRRIRSDKLSDVVLGHLQIEQDFLLGDAVIPGGEGLVQLALDRPIAAAVGDRIVLRDTTGQRTVEGGKWVGSARATFDGVVIAHNERLERKPELLNHDAFGEGWMLIVRPAHDDWRDGLVTGGAIVPAFEAWMATSAYKNRTE